VKAIALVGVHAGRLVTYSFDPGKTWAVCDTDGCDWRSNRCLSEDGARKAWVRHVKRVGEVKP
jgi:hypothetical protein